MKKKKGKRITVQVCADKLVEIAEAISSLDRYDGDGLADLTFDGTYLEKVEVHYEPRADPESAVVYQG